ncbi:MAG: hypothetical protein ACOCWA_08900 [Bacteroidota bacterium]
MKNIFYSLSLIFLSLLSGCEKEDSIKPELQGKWIESSLRKDTIIFNSPDFDFGENWFDLKREGMISSGPYEYRIHGDSISIHWMLSSCMCWPAYYFKALKGRDEFRIGKFYDSEELDSEILVFEKLKQ